MYALFNSTSVLICRALMCSYTPQAHTHIQNCMTSVKVPLNLVIDKVSIIISLNYTASLMYLS